MVVLLRNEQLEILKRKNDAYANVAISRAVYDMSAPATYLIPAGAGCNDYMVFEQ